MTTFARKLTGLWVFLVFMGVIGCGKKPPVNPPPPPPQLLGVLHLAVQDARTGARLQDAQVEVTDTSNKWSGRTDATGYKGFVLPRPRGYHVEVSLENYYSQGVGVDVVEAEQTKEVILTPITPPVQPRTGIVRLHDTTLVDDQGAWFADGVTLFPALALRHRYSQQLHERFCIPMRDRGVKAARILGTVGGAPWRHLAMDPLTPEYPALLAQTIDYLYDECGVRTALTLFGGIDFAPTAALQREATQVMLNVIKPRLHKIAWVEVANESWQTGFAGNEGMGRLHAIARILTSQLPQNFPVALSATAEFDPVTEMREMWGGFDGANIHTPHLQRDIWKVDGRYRPARQPWGWREAMEIALNGGGPRTAINNEGIGPGSSVASERDPSVNVAHWIVSRIARMTGHIFHFDAGVWACHIGEEFLGGHSDGLRGRFCGIDDEPGVVAALDGMAAIRNVLPADVHTWQRTRPGLANHPFDPFHEFWPEGHPNGVVRLYCSIRENDFVCLALGIRSHVNLVARHPMDATVYNMKGQVVERFEGPEGRALHESVDTSQLIIGRYR